MAIGSGFAGKGGAALLYRSPDLRHWTYLHPLFEGPMKEGATGKDTVATGEMWECPDFFRIGDKYVFLVSTQRKVFYYVGDYKDHRFHPEQQGEVDFGAYYAPKSFVAADGRQVLWGWLTEKRSKEEQIAAGWSGAMSLPRVMSLNSENRLVQQPWPGVQSLRGKKTATGTTTIAADSRKLLPGLSGDCVELIAEIDPGQAKSVGLMVRCSPDQQEQTRIVYRPGTQEIEFGSVKGTLQSRPGATMQLRLFLDGSVGELYANGGTACLTHRLYPKRQDALQIGVFAEGGAATLKSLQLWPVTPVSKDRLTS